MFPKMVNATIGTLTFLDVGTIPPQTERLQVWSRPGVPGLASRKVGLRGVPTQFRASIDVAAATGAALATLRDNLTEKLQGEVVTYTDNFGIVEDNVLVVEALLGPGSPFSIVTPCGGTLAVGTATHIFVILLTLAKKL